MKKRFTAVALAVIGLCVGVLVAEGVLYLLGLPKFYLAHSGPSQFEFKLTASGTLIYTNTLSDTIEFIYDGNPRGYFDGNSAVTHTTNAWGFRGDAFSFEKDSGILRIAFIGDSFTFGEGVKDSDTYAEQVRRALEERSSDLTVEIYNFGVGGYNTSQSVFLLENLALHCRPDIVVLGYTLNDAEPELFHYDSATNIVSRRPRETRRQEGLSQQTPPNGKIVFRLRTARLIWQMWNARKLSDQTIDYYHALYRDGRKDWKKTENALQRYQQVCADKGIQCHVVMFPILFRLGDDYPFQAIHDRVVAQIGSGVNVIDMLPVLRGMNHNDLWVHPTDQHPNEVVHAMVGDTLAKVLYEQMLQPVNRP